MCLKIGKEGELEVVFFCCVKVQEVDGNWMKITHQNWRQNLMKIIENR